VSVHVRKFSGQTILVSPQIVRFLVDQHLQVDVSAVRTSLLTVWHIVDEYVLRLVKNVLNTAG